MKMRVGWDRRSAMFGGFGAGVVLRNSGDVICMVSFWIG